MLFALLVGVSWGADFLSEARLLLQKPRQDWKAEEGLQFHPVGCVWDRCCSEPGMQKTTGHAGRIKLGRMRFEAWVSADQGQLTLSPLAPIAPKDLSLDLRRTASGWLGGHDVYVQTRDGQVTKIFVQEDQAALTESKCVRQDPPILVAPKKRLSDGAIVVPE